jgi:hypothetical protein
VEGGNVTHEWGSATNPTYLVYDTATNQVKNLYTYRATGVNWDSASWPGGGQVADATTSDDSPRRRRGHRDYGCAGSSDDIHL